MISEAEYRKLQRCKNMDTIFRRPMLACSDQPTREYLIRLLQQGPLLLTPKCDGIRGMTGGWDVVSRTLKQIPNDHIRESIATLVQDHRLDGEIVCIDEMDRMYDFNTTQSLVMSRGGTPRFCYYIFDTWDVDDDYQGRVGWLYRKIKERTPWTQLLLPEWAFSIQDVDRICESHIARGFEGTIARTPLGRYKNGRATMREAWMLKLKPFEDDEAIVVGFEPLRRNLNEPTLNALGLQERSSHRVNLHATEMLGALVVECHKWGQFKIGTGFTELQRCKIWAEREQHLMQPVTFKYQKNHSKDKPHAATFKAFRSLLDYAGPATEEDQAPE